MTRKEQWKKAGELFLYFFRIGWYTFGGGWSIVAQIQQDYVEKKHYITSEELIDLTSVGKSLPGVMIGNVSLMFGYTVAGVPGAILSLFGMAIPPVVILAVVTTLYSSFRENVYVARALTAVRACVVPIILRAAVKLIPSAFPKWYSYVIFAAAICILLFTNVSAILVVIGAALIGVALSFTGKGKEARS